MDAVTKDAVMNAEPQPESTTSGEPTGSVNSGEAGTQAAEEKGTETSGLFDGMTAEQLHKSYKSIQGEYTKNQQLLKKLEKYGGPDQIIQWADYLNNNPDFAQWMQSQKSKNDLGIDESKLDPETKAAYDAVRKISENIADQKLRATLQNEIGPLAETLKNQLLEKAFDQMDEKYGNDWEDMRDMMSELSDTLPQKSQDRPTFEDIEDLYFKALRKSGKFDSYAAKVHEKTLKAKQAKATGKPQTTTAASAPRASKSLAEAFADAKRQLNLTS